MAASKLAPRLNAFRTREVRAAARRGPGHWPAGSRSGGWIADRPCLVVVVRSSPDGAPPFRILPAAGGCAVVVCRALSRWARSANPVAPLFLFNHTEKRNHAKAQKPRKQANKPLQVGDSDLLRFPAHQQGNANSAARNQIVISTPPVTLHPPSCVGRAQAARLLWFARHDRQRSVAALDLQVRRCRHFALQLHRLLGQ